MAKITQPGEGRQSTDARLDSRGPAFTTGGAMALGQAEKAFGREIENFGKQYFEAAKNSIHDSFYNDAISTATLELNKRYNERLASPVDKNGNPNFGSLDDDIKKIAEDIKAEVGFKLIDPQVASKFDRSFGSMVTNKRLQGQGQARKQHMQYAQSTLKGALDSYVASAESDDDSNLNLYTGQINNTIEDAVDNGVIDREEADRLLERYTDSVRVAANQKLISEDPKGAAQHLSQPAEKLGMSKREKAKLEKIAKAAARDEDRLIKSQFGDIQKKVKYQQEKTAADLEIGIIKGTIGEEDVETAASSNMDTDELIRSLHPKVGEKLVSDNPFNITQKQRVKLIRQIQKKQLEDENKALKAIDIDSAKENGERLSAKFRPQDIEDRYQADIEQLSRTDEEGNKIQPNIVEKAEVASQYNSPLKRIKDEIKFGLHNASGEDADLTLRAYEIIKRKQPAVLDKLAKKDRAIASYASMLVNHTNINPERALEISREANIKAEKSEVRIEREDEFKSIKDFKPAQVEDTIKNIFNLDSFLGFGGKTLQPGIKSRFESLLREAYIETGDSEAAKEVLRDQVAHTYGVSEFNEIPGVLDDTERFMFMPPEIAYPGVPSADLKKNLVDNITPFLPKGISADKIGISSDELTRATGDKVTYGLFYIDDKGREIVINGPNGVPLRWEPDYEDLLKKQASKAVSEAKVSRKESFKRQQEVRDIDVGDFGF